jgi:hypothetical protein
VCDGPAFTGGESESDGDLFYGVVVVKPEIVIRHVTEAGVGPLDDAKLMPMMVPGSA